jgi:phosphoribosylformylglycinamidine cyclo-ligase
MPDPRPATEPAATYASAGVDVEAGDRAVELIRGAVSRTHGPQVLGGIGGFAGLLDVSALKGYRRPLLATSTDGVGTKVAIAQALDTHDTIGFDLVGMVVDDVVVCGARPLLMTDYIACGKVVPERIAAIVAGVAAACEQAGCPLVGGETAEHPGLLGPTEYDLAGAASGVVEADDLLGPHRVQAGDAVIALASSGLHSNGYSLVRKVIEIAGWTIYRHVAELGHSLGEELLIPTRVYAPDVLDLAAALGGDMHALAHVTGGGLAANLARVLPRGTEAVVDRGTWTPATIFDLIARLGTVPRPEMERTFNLGVGMLAVVAPEREREAVARLSGRGVPAWRCGQVACVDDAGPTSESAVVRGTKGVDGGSVRMVGDHPRA